MNRSMSSDKYLLLVTVLSDLTSGQKNIGDCIHVMEEIVETKQFYSDFYGEDSREYRIAKGLYGLCSAVARSIRFQKECKEQKLSDWVLKIPSRSDQLRRIQELVDV